MREHEALLRPREPDVAEPPLLLEPLLLDRARVREDALLHPDEEDRAELEALSVVERHESDEAALLLDGVLIGEERNLLQKLREGRALRILLVLARDADKLLEVLGSPLRLDRALGLECLQVAALLEHALEELGHRELERAGHGRLHERAELVDRLERRAATAGLFRVVERLPEREPVGV